MTTTRKRNPITPTRYTNEVIVRLENGRTIRSGTYDGRKVPQYLSGEYVRICDRRGRELAYWDAQEWKDEPMQVMGAIINLAAGIRLRRSSP